jgi:para-aminobenzoate synthetase/4-amino-4-deoxychorismate lyase
MTAGIIETLRVRDGCIPLLERHVARLERACAALGLPFPVSLQNRLAPWCGGQDCVVRVRVGPDGLDLTSRPLPRAMPLTVLVARTLHRPYPHKVVERAPFEAALAEARAAGADDALLLTADGYVAEGARWSVFWWEGERLATPPLSLGVLPGVARERLGELVELVEVRCRPDAIVGRAIFAANAARGIVRIERLDDGPVGEDPRTVDLGTAFWPTAGEVRARRTC